MYHQYTASIVKPKNIINQKVLSGFIHYVTHSLSDEEGATIFAKRFDIKDENKRQIVSTSAEKTTVGSKKLEILGNFSSHESKI